MRVNVDDIAFMDRRFKLLGGRLSMTWQEALGRCLPVWALAYAKRTAILPAGDVDALAERPGFADAMVLVDLASEEPSGAVYLCGVNDRIDFLLMQDAKREKAREARLAAAGVQSPPGRSRGEKSSPPGPSRGDLPGTGSYSPDLPPDADHAPEDQIQSAPVLPRDPAVGVPAPPAVPAPVPTPVPAPVLRGAQDLSDRRRRLIGKAWQLAGEAFLRVQGSGIDPTAPNGWSGLPSASTVPMRNLAARLDEMLVGESPDFAAAEARIANRIAVSEAEARALTPPTSRFMTPARMWDPTSFSIGADMSPEQAATPMHRGARAGPRGSAERAPKRDVRVGRVEPSDPSAYHETPDDRMPF